MGFHRRVSIRDRRGFTVVELFIVLAIISTLLGLGMFSYNKIRDRLDAERQMKEMFTDLMNARVRAMQRNRTHFVVFTASQYTIYEDTSPEPDGDGTLTIGADEQFQQKNLHPKFPVTWPVEWTPASPLRFDGKGIVPTDPTDGVGGDPPWTVRLSTATSGEYDCIKISEIKITLGKWDGTTCLAR